MKRPNSGRSKKESQQLQVKAAKKWEDPGKIKNKMLKMMILNLTMRMIREQAQDTMRKMQ